AVLYNGFLEREDGLWISTAAGMAFYDFKTKQFYHRYHNPEGKPILEATLNSPDYQSDLEQDSKGKLWFIWESEKLASYDFEADRLDTFDFEKPAGTWRCCWSISVDAKDNIWIGSRHGGVFVFDQVSKKFTSLKDDGVNRLIQSDYIYSIERGPDGQMFVAS